MWAPKNPLGYSLRWGSRGLSGTPACGEKAWDLVNGALGRRSQCARGSGPRAQVLLPGESGRRLSASAGQSPPSPFPRVLLAARPPPPQAAASASNGPILKWGSLPPPHPPERVEGPTWPDGAGVRVGGEEREITPFGIRGRRRPGGWGEPAARLCGCGGPKTPALPRDRDAV